MGMTTKKGGKLSQRIHFESSSTLQKTTLESSKGKGEHFLTEIIKTSWWQKVQTAFVSRALETPLYLGRKSGNKSTLRSFTFILFIPHSPGPVGKYEISRQNVLLIFEFKHLMESLTRQSVPIGHTCSKRRRYKMLFHLYCSGTIGCIFGLSGSHRAICCTSLSMTWVWSVEKDKRKLTKAAVCLRAAGSPWQGAFSFQWHFKISADSSCQSTYESALICFRAGLTAAS